MKILVKSLSGILQKESLALPQGHNGQSHPWRLFSHIPHPGRTTEMELLESWMWLKGHKGSCLTWRVRIPWNPLESGGIQTLRSSMVLTRHHSGNFLHCSEQRKPLQPSYISFQLSPCLQHHSSKPAAAWTLGIVRTGRVHHKIGNRIYSESKHLILETLAGLNLTADELFSPSWLEGHRHPWY